MKKLTVISPVYNVQSELEDYLTIIDAMSEKEDIQFVFVDDGSTDLSWNLLKAFKDRNPQMDIDLVHQKNRGVGHARNVGLDKAQGKYIWFTDPDDLFELQLIMPIVKELEKRSGDLVFFQYEKFSHKNDLVFGESMFDASIIKTLDKLTMFRHYSIGKIENYTWAFIATRELYDSANIVFPNRNYEDVSVVFKIYNLAKKIYSYEDTVVYYRSRQSSIIHTFTSRNYDDFLIAIQELKDSSLDCPESIKNWYLFGKYCLMWDMLRNLDNVSERTIRQTELKQKILEMDYKTLNVNKELVKLILSFNIHRLYRPFKIYGKILGSLTPN
ncbi:glycosyltransferase [Weissella cibaria]|uniref:glycosyltransferase family 2 protein n=1 Tax=Weissella cibaria TaxID=137591 RepID=UPI0011916F57|nr:glycosyltransferase [Weissella cibaria]MCA1355651.1 glycosyltransferase [Weissella cibaria]MDQ2125646.1 glycosyltransferase [Weissella cibaria]MDQ2157807.1 glycosyltransferase [Weissella cibaria]TVV34874.1 glycosyltransferase [Weissella cibaria]